VNNDEPSLVYVCRKWYIIDIVLIGQTIMIQPEQVSQLKELISRASDIFVIFPKKANYDQLASAAALSLVLQESGKNVRLLSPRLSDQPEGLTGLEQTTDQIGNQNLCISFDYVEEQVEKVSYHIGEDSQKFYLTIKPQKGHQPLDSSKVEFSYTGAETDLIILVGVSALDSLGQLYYGYEDTYRNLPMVSINTHETDLGNLRLDLSGATCLSEGVAKALFDIGLSVSSDAATNLLAAIEDATSQFQSFSASALTFEMAARLMQHGARRVHRHQSGQLSLAESQSRAEGKFIGNGEVQMEEVRGKSRSVQNVTAEESGDDSATETPEQFENEAKASRKTRGTNSKSESKKSKTTGGLDYQPNESAPRGG
jgi:nanoRNase/pAp phosphatase (c-di-AMP/oligoRNAs hydrolase)